MVSLAVVGAIDDGDNAGTAGPLAAEPSAGGRVGTGSVGGGCDCPVGA